MLGKELEVTLNNAFKNAHDKRHEFITVEHLLLALLDNASAGAVIVACGCDIKALRGQLTQFIDETISLIPEGIQRDTQPTLGFQRVLQRAVFHVQASDKKEVSGANLFVALFSEQDSHAVYLLNKQDVSRLDVVNYMAHGISKFDQDTTAGEDQPADINAPDAEAAGSPLEKYTVNLNEEAD
jgi:ATP-dependent Clp protease ATP-binding subunit ClpA